MKPKRKDPNSRTIDPLKKFSAWQVRDADRDISAEIIDVLRSIDFDHGRLKDLVDEEEYRTMIKVRDVAARMLGVSPGIFDEVARIGLDVCYAAKAWKEAVEDGMPSKARYAKLAVASGASTFWSSIPEDKEDERAAVLKNREEYFANFRLAIRTGEKIDNLEKRIAEIHTRIEIELQERREFAEEVTRLLTADGGWERLVRVYRSFDNLSHLAFDDMDLAMQLWEDMSRDRKLMRLRGQYSADRQELVARDEELAKLGLVLRMNPDQSNRDLTAELAKLTKRMEDELSHRMSELAVIETENKNEMDRLDSIINGPAAKVLTGSAVAHLKKLLGGDRLSPEMQAVLDANIAEVQRQNRMREEWQLEKARQAEAARQAEEARQAALEAARQAQENVETAQAVNENTSDESQVNVNVNF